MITRILNVERPGLSAYVTAGRDGTVRFWHKATLNHLRCIDHGDSVRRRFKKLVQASAQACFKTCSYLCNSSNMCAQRLAASVVRMCTHILHAHVQWCNQSSATWPALHAE
jgi:hypothetical protein